jgi:hypothetical protein
MLSVISYKTMDHLVVVAPAVMAGALSGVQCWEAWRHMRTPKNRKTERTTKDETVVSWRVLRVKKPVALPSTPQDWPTSTVAVSRKNGVAG